MDLISTIGGATGSFLYTADRVPARSDDRGVRPRVRTFLGRTALRRRRNCVLDRLRARALRLDRPARDALEDLGHSARRLCQVRGRRQRGERARQGGARPDDAAGARRSASRTRAWRDGRRWSRPDRSPISSSPSRSSPASTTSTDARSSNRASRSIEPGSAAERAGFLPDDLIVSINGSKIDSFADMQRCGERPGR